MRHALRAAATLAVIASLIPLIGLTELRLKEASLAGLDEVGERYHMPPPRLLRALTFGFNELAADLVWLRMIVYYTDRLSSDRDYRHLRRYLDTVLALDDRLEELYRYAPPMFALRSDASQSNDNVLTAIRLLERAHELHPNNPRIAFNIGAYYLGELKTKSPAQRARWRRKAADWLHRASLVGSHVPWLPALVAKLHTEQGRRGLAIKHLEELYLTTQAPELKRQIAAKLRAMQSAQIADELREHDRRFAERHQATLPYVSADLFVQVGLEPLKPFSLRPPAVAEGR